MSKEDIQRMILEGIRRKLAADPNLTDEERRRLEDLDGKPQNEVTIFFKYHPTRYPLADFFLAAIARYEVGMAITDHQLPGQGETAYRFCYSYTEANAVYDQMIEHCVNREFVMAYRGARNQG